MNLIFDTSALVKKYVQEEGSDLVSFYWDQVVNFYVSSISLLETISTFRRLLHEKAITSNDFLTLKKEVEIDFQYFTIINFDVNISKIASKITEKYQLKTLDSIHLSSALLIKKSIDGFVVFDKKLISASKKEKIKVITK